MRSCSFLIAAFLLSTSIPAAAQTRTAKDVDGIVRPLPPLPDLSAMKTAVVTDSDQQNISSDRIDEIVPGQIYSDGSIEAPVFGVVTDTDKFCWASVVSDGWEFLLQSGTGWSGRCPKLEQGAYDIVSFHGSQVVRISFFWGKSTLGHFDWLFRAPQTIQLVPHGQKKPKFHFSICSIYSSRNLTSGKLSGAVDIERCSIGYETGVLCN